MPSAKTILISALVLGSATFGTPAGPQVSTDKPIINFRLPMFTPEGNREWLARGSEARFVNRDQVDVKELTLTIFDEEKGERVTTMILSPDATVLPSKAIVTGPSSIRVIDDEFEASGSQWRYDHKQRNIQIKQNVHVVFRAQLKGLLQ